MKGIDCTVKIDTEMAKELKVAGYDFVCRYLVPEKYQWKRLVKDETIAMANAGLYILSIFETTANRASIGNVGGQTDGKLAYAEAKKIGQPEGSAIYFAVDYDAKAVDYKAIEAYLKAAQEQIPGYHVGVYGSYAVCEEMYKRGIKYLWQTYAWSAGKKSPHKNVFQYKNGVKVCDIDCDLNESYGNEGFWTMTPKYKKIWLTHVFEFDPMTIKAAKVIATGAKIATVHKNFVNSNFFDGSNIIGWLISEGQIINRRDEYKTWKGNPKGTLIVYKDGTVECGLKLDSDIAPIVDKIWFCCQGFNLFPFILAREGMTDKSIARSTNRVSIGYNRTTGKIILAIRPYSDAPRAIKTLKNLGCNTGICLDSGESVNLCKDGKMLFKTDRTLTNILHW